jgi:ABC-type iron transport system FetAB ATPase subunit
MSMNSEPQKPQDDSDLDGISLTREPVIPASVDDALSPEIAKEIEQLEYRLREVLARQRTSEGITDEPVEEIDGAEAQRISLRINQLRRQQREHVAAMAEDGPTTTLG